MWKQEHKEKQNKHTKNTNMSRKYQRAQKTEKYNQGKYDFLCKLENFAFIFHVFCNMILNVFKVLIYA